MRFSGAEQWAVPPGRCLPDGHHRHAHKSFLHITARLQGGGLLGDYLEDLKASPPRCSRHLTRTHRHRPGAVRLRSHEGDSAVSWGGRRGGAVGQSDRCEKLLSPLVTTARYPWKQLEPALNTGLRRLPLSWERTLPQPAVLLPENGDRRQPTRGPAPGPSPALPSAPPCPGMLCRRNAHSPGATPESSPEPGFLSSGTPTRHQSRWSPLPQAQSALRGKGQTLTAS